MPKIGTNLTGCLRSIADGEVNIEDVALILTATQYLTREEMVADIRKLIPGLRISMHIANAELLWNTGRIFQSLAPKTYKRRAKSNWLNCADIFTYT